MNKSKSEIGVNVLTGGQTPCDILCSFVKQIFW